MSKTLGYLEAQFFAYVQRKGLTSVKIGDLAGPLGLTSDQERKLLSRMSRRGWIARVRRGLYLVPSILPAGGKWSPGEFRVLATLMEDRDAQYQICGPNTFYRYGWDDQVPNRLYAYNDKISGDRQTGSVQLTLIKVAKKRLGAIDNVETSDGISVKYSSKARALMDAVYDWSRFNSLPRAYDWIRVELKKDDAIAADLINVCLQFGNQSTLRRIGKLLEMENVSEPLLRKIQKPLRPSSSFIPWNPSLPKRGKIDQRWGVVFNESG